MDYCQPCQRHLNGALACAGCGTPAEALGPYAVPPPLGHEPEARDEQAASPLSAGHRRRERDAARTRGGAHGGRGPGRRRTAPDERPRRGRRGRSRKGRAVLLALFGVVLAAGALSLAELATEPDGGDGASDYVREATSATTAPAPEPTVSETAEPPGPVRRPPGSPSAVPATVTRSPGATRSARATDEARPGGATSAPAAPAPASSVPPSPAASPTTGGPSEPGGTGDAPTPSVTPQRPTPTPTPTPSPAPSDDDCWFPWFC
ncbi:SCO2400 family protein [Streptomyces sp. OR43]|uniref:SCO2400 family protein n=1 Tax=Streptomyces sp. or43 TaxID=2478957 RepID=UPI0011CDE8C0|nr:hypothetical protein [Streptomyces sp. or43]TXS42389.1 hypothetical protein EAO72_12805 [Streptomyces sp. or43]